MFYAVARTKDGSPRYFGFNCKSQREWWVAAHHDDDAQAVTRYDVVLQRGKDFVVDENGRVKDRFGNF